MKRTTIKGLADGDMISPKLDNDLYEATISVKFYSDGSYNTLVTPTDGVVVFAGSEDGDLYSSINNGTVYATKVGGLNQYSRPSYKADISYIRARFANITGATHAIVTISQFEDR